MKSEGRLDTIPVEKIDFGERARKDYKDIPGLARDIQTRGQIQPIAVMEKQDGTFLLLAGGRRTRACQHLAAPTIQAKIYPAGLTPLEIKSIELMENLVREDLSYEEKIALEREIYELQVEIHGKKSSTAKDAEGTSIRDVAKMLGVSAQKLSEDLSLSKAMEQLPDVGWDTCKNRQDALKLKKNIGRSITTHIAAKAVEESYKDNKGEDVLIQKLSNAYVIGDFFEKVKKIPDNAINLVELDPPYSIMLDKIKKKVGPSNYSYGEKGYNEISPEDYHEFMERTFKECYRVMSNDSFLLCWFGPDPWFYMILDLLRKTGFTVRGIPCIWVKGEDKELDGYVEVATGQTNSPMRHLGLAYEMFFYAKKGDPKIANMGRTNVFGYKPVSPAKKIHPTERPLEMMEDILTTFGTPGNRVLVPFAGSGNTLIAAAKNRMVPIGFDLGEGFKEGYTVRLKEVFK